MPEPVLLAIDQGTSSTKVILVDRRGRVVRAGGVPVWQTHPQPGWVEQDAAAIRASVRRAVRETLTDDEVVEGVAISVQRESVVLWDTTTGAAIGPILSWQDQRTADVAAQLAGAGHGDAVFAATGLPIDPMFSALKAAWLLDRYDPDRLRTGSGEWRLGTIDSWLLAQFGGEPVIETGNASRTQLLNIDTAAWDPALLALFRIPVEGLPTVVSSMGPFPAVRGLAPIPDGTPVLSVLADSHAALFAHAGWRRGVVKATFGTGSSVMTVGPRGDASAGVCSTVAWHVDEVVHGLEANIRSTGRTMSWLAELFRVDVGDLWSEAAGAASDGVMIVPAFGGLGAPYWDPAAEPIISGLSLSTGRAQLARAAVEAIAFQVDDAVRAVDALAPVEALACDGGMTQSGMLMQLQADVSGLPVDVSPTPNLSARGAADLAGLRAGWWSITELEEGRGLGPRPRIQPGVSAETRDALRARWRTAITRSRVG